MPKPNNAITRTLILLKPDAIERNLTGEILKRFEKKGLRIVASEMRWIDKGMAEKHYAEHKGNPPHFKAMTEALTRGPLMAVVLEGPAVVACSRQLIGSQSPLYHSQVGTIRADLAIEEPFNLVHGSDSDAAAKREITLWFGAAMCKVSAKQQTVNVKPNPNYFDQNIPVTMPDIPKVPKKKPQTDPAHAKAYAEKVLKFLETNEGNKVNDMGTWINKIGLSELALKEVE